jgi:hypothetical protein
MSSRQRRAVMSGVNQPGGKASTTAILEVLASFRRSAPVPSGRACTSTPTVAGIQSGNISSGSSSDTHHGRIVRIGHRPCSRDPTLGSPLAAASCCRSALR